MIPHVPVANAGQVASTAMLSRWRGNFRVTAIAKATFAFAPGAEMPLAPPVEIAGADVHAAKNPMRSVRASSDACPHLERADILFVGRAHVPRGESAEHLRVRLAVADDSRAVLDKRLDVVGDRAMRPGAPPSAPTRFQNMPIVYEKALGGLGWPDNPLGVGAGVDARTLPNILYPDPSMSERVAGYGPLAAAWPMRKKLLRGKGRPSVDALMDLPDDFDWSYFQSAPIDQQIDALPARAWVLLEGLNARTELLQMRLPAITAVAKLFGVGSEPVLPLRADTLFIDGDAEHCTVTWRGSFQVPNLDILAGAWVGFTLEGPNRPAVWPERPAASAEAPRAPVFASRSATIAIDDVRPPVAGAPAGRAFAGTMVIEDAPPPPPPTGRRAPGTMILEDSAPPPPPVPFGRKAPGTMILDVPAPASAPGSAPRPSFTGTLDGSDASLSAKLPFTQGAHPQAARRSEPPGPLPGAPWGGPGSSAVVAARSPLSGTMTLDEDQASTMLQAAPRAPLPAPPPPAPAAQSVDEPRAPAPPVPVPPPAPSKPAMPRRRSDAYQKAIERPTSEVPIAPKPKPALPQKQDIGGALYRRKKP